MATLANHIIAQVVLARTSGLPEDVVTNTFHFRNAGALSWATAVDGVADALIDFYNGLTSPATTFPVCTFINDQISRTSNASKINVYDGSIPEGSRAPATSTFTLGAAASSNALPDECALCLSFKCENTTIPFARQRGRVYVGPLNYDGVAAISAGDVRPDATFTSRLLDAAVRLADNAKADGGFWGIYSPSSNAINRVEESWVDNAFDTMRKRGQDSSSRAILWP